MGEENVTNRDEAAYWASAAALKWIEHEAAMDAALAPVLEAVLEMADLQQGQAVLDIGCGTGASVLAAASRVGTGGWVDGIDISPPLLERARHRTEEAGLKNVSLTLADAQAHGFAPACHDCAISRFGVMFFDDSAAAFSNIARGLRPGGRLVFASWAGVSKNPWFSIPLRAATDRLGTPAPMDRHAPGPFAFQDLDHVSDLLAQAGLASIAAREQPVALSPQGNAREAASIARKVGAAARVMAELGGTDEDAQVIETEVARRFKEFEGPTGVRVPAAINLFTAVRR